ncbi:MAG: hypothetical protein QW692_02570 [Nitrososphaerota archaeon]
MWPRSIHHRSMKHRGREPVAGNGLETASRAIDDVQRALEEELERLKSRSGYHGDLKVSWIPKAESRLSGEVRGGVIYIYELEADKALETLRHEFVDFMVSRAIEPYREVANKLMELVNEMLYRRKEEVVKALLKLLD